MNDPENFDALRKLLALKRHEQPPPGYFDRLPGQIMARLQPDEARNSWWQRFMSTFTLKPAMAYSMGLAFCAVLTVGIIYSVNVQPDQTASKPLPTEPWRAPNPSALASEAPHAVPPTQNTLLASTNPVPAPQPSLFDYTPTVMPASYQPK